MAKDIIIFGAGVNADIVQFYMREVSRWPVKAFTVNEKFIKEDTFNRLPLVPFENIENTYPPDKYCMFVIAGYHDLLAINANKILEVEAKGYDVISYTHPDAPKDLKHGKNCFVMQGACIHPRVTLGNNVFVWSGAIIGHHSTVGSNNWFASGAGISGNVTIGDNCFFSVNCTVGHRVEIGNEVFVGANTLIIKNVPDGSVIIKESDKPIKLNSKQFLKMSKFNSL
jgi:sugar O-acyltransferase (sialic acid O-acetyltransferase NeuD family)